MLETHKKKDRHASRVGGRTIVERRPKSVKSGRRIEKVAASSAGAAPAKKKKRPPASRGLATLPGATARQSPPRDLSPELATLTVAPPDGDQWLHEVKFDGYRILAVKVGKRVTLWSRNGKDWTARFRAIADAMKVLEGDAVLDGEVVALNTRGVSDFQCLQRTLRGENEAELHYFAFDLPWRDEVDLRAAPLTERKAVLRELLSGEGIEEGGRIRYSDHQLGAGPAFYRAACGNDLEGIICKRASSPYRGRRTRDWLKVKCVRRQEFVVGGFTEPSGTREGFGALLLGVHEEGKGLRYSGRVGTGFDDALLTRLRAKLDRLTRETPAFVDPPEGSEARDVTWVRPELVAEVAFAEWTREGRLRHPSFRGLREDKEAAEVRRETPGAAQARPGDGRRSARRKRAGKKNVEVEGITISHPERAVFPDVGITKGEVAAYYAHVAPQLLPHIANRPLSVVRCPEGRQNECFYQKHRGPGMPETIGTVAVKEKKGREEYLTVDSAEGVVALVQFGVIEFHPWLARNDRLDRPDAMVFDLDPAEDVAWEEVQGAALLLRDLLGNLELESFLKLTGGKGLHVVAPLVRRQEFDLVKAAARAIAERMREQNPGKLVTSASKAKREGRIFVDYLRNGRGATAVAPFSARARAGAPVAVPVAWDELRPGFRSDEFSLTTLPRRLASLRRDPWKNYFQVKQSLRKEALRDLGVD